MTGAGRQFNASNKTRLIRLVWEADKNHFLVKLNLKEITAFPFPAGTYPMERRFFNRRPPWRRSYKQY